jgi:hypothetical protein
MAYPYDLMTVMGREDVIWDEREEVAEDVEETHMRCMVVVTDYVILASHLCGSMLNLHSAEDAARVLSLDWMLNQTRSFVSS